MLINLITKILEVPSYFYRNFAIPHIYSFKNRAVLKKNLSIKNRYAGKRCFLIGGGPSIANTDLSLLKKEYAFVVNEFEKNNQNSSFTPTFHILIESNYYTKDGPEYWRERFLNKDKDIATTTTMIININAKSFIEDQGLFKHHNIYYVGTEGIFTNNFPFNIRLDRYVPHPKNSMLMCMMAATWMGFSEIYLLGCEHSFLAQPLGKNKSLDYSHSYGSELSDLDEMDENVLKKYITQKEMNFNYELNMASTLQLFRNYRLFYAKARKTHPDLEIYNATPNSFLDIFPMVNFNDIKIK